MTRRALAARLARLEAARPPAWEVPLEDGGTYRLDLLEGLQVLQEGIAVTVAIRDGEEFPVPSPALAVLGYARADASEGLLGGVLIGAARTVRAHLAGGDQ